MTSVKDICKTFEQYSDLNKNSNASNVQFQTNDNDDTNTSNSELKSTPAEQDENENLVPSTLVRRSKRHFKSKTQIENQGRYHEEHKYYSQPTSNSIERSADKQCHTDRTSFLEHIVEELVTTEENFVHKLKLGFENYRTIFDNRQDLPRALIGKKYVLFRTIEEIIDFHDNEMLPMLQSNKFNLEQLCIQFCSFVEENKFYPHLLFIMHKRRAENLCKLYKKFFDEKAKDLNDNLGLTSFLIQPLHRVTKYPLLFQQIIKDCFKNYDMKIALQLCCKTEKKIDDFVKLINESERIGSIINFEAMINPYEQGLIVKVGKLFIYDYNIQRRFKGRVFLFEKSLIYTEIISKLNSEVLKYRGILPCKQLSISVKDPGFTLYLQMNNQICDFEAKSEDLKNSWISAIKFIVSHPPERQSSEIA